MKTMRNLFLLCAGLSLFACSSDDDATQQLPEGTGMVEVRVVNPTTRITTGPTVDITGTITVTLYYAGTSMSQEVTPSQASSVRFWNITSPEKVTASINGGTDTYASINITQNDVNAQGGNLQAEPSSIPAYGETSAQNFVPTGVMTPTSEEQNSLNNGLTEETKGKTFQKWSASVKMAIPVARLEVGSITHEAHSGVGDDCLFRSGELLIKGVYLDNTSLNGGSYTYDADPNNIKYSSVTGVDHDGIGNAILSESIETPATSFNETAFNFYATTTNPIFKVYFSSANLATGGVGQGREGWAMIKSYKSGGEEITLENGKIYTITSVELKDENIVGGENNDAVYGVDVTVEEAVWQVVEIEDVWEGDE